MKRRWFIRICFMLPILLCVVGWVWGATRFAHIMYVHSGHWVACGPSSGFVNVAFGQNPRKSDGWEWSVIPQSARFGPGGTPYFLGFSFRHILASDMYMYMFGVPYWFLLIIFSAVLFVVWRKTGKPKPGRAFPVEPSQPTAEQRSKAI